MRVNSKAFLIAAAFLISVSCGSKESQAEKPAPASEQPAKDLSNMEVKELKLTDIKTGDGREAMAGHTVTVHYTGWLLNGTKFDSSKDRGEPFKFQLGSGMVIPGWDQGVAGMKIGGVRELLIPSDLAYGPRGAGGVIPPNAALRFEVELLGVE